MLMLALFILIVGLPWLLAAMLFLVCGSIMAPRSILSGRQQRPRFDGFV